MRKRHFQEGWTDDVTDDLLLDTKIDSQYLRLFSVKTLSDYLKKLSGRKKILDAGCADGKLLGPFVKQHEIWGVDISSRFVKFAQKRGIKAKIGDLEKRLPFQDRFFDVVVIHHVLEHIMATDIFLAECNRVLKNGGIIFLTFPNVNSPISLILLLLDYPIYMGARYRSTHVRDFTLRTAKIALLNNGFKIEQIFGGSFVIFKNNFLSGITKYFPRLAADITLKAKKVKAVGKGRIKYEYGVSLRDYFKDLFR